MCETTRQQKTKGKSILEVEINKGRSDRRGDPVIDLVLVGVQGLGGVHVVAEVLRRLLHGLQLAGVGRGTPLQSPLWDGEGSVRIRGGADPRQEVWGVTAGSAGR